MELTQSISSVLLANGIVIGAAVVQTSTGMGFGMIAAPLLALISLEYVPGPMLFVNLFLSLIMLGDGRHHIVGREISVLLPTIVLGTLTGAALIMLLPTATLGIVMATLILGAVAVTLFARALPMTSRNLSVCGVAVGIMGTATGIPGGPLVILYQNEPLQKTRPTMAVVFTFSYCASLIALAFAGAFTLNQAALGLAMLPGLLIGYGIGRLGRGGLSAGLGRILMLSIAGTGAVMLLLKSL